MYLDIPREDSANSLIYSYLELKFDVKQKTGSVLCADGDRIRLVIVGPIAILVNIS